MATNTPNYNLPMPEVGADDDIWGGLLNDAIAAIDVALKSVSDQVIAAAEAARIKVGDLYLSTDAADPATKLGYGTWQAYGAGRALVGVGAADGVSYTAGQTRGAAAHTLTQAQMPSHAHVADPPNTGVYIAPAGDHTHLLRGLANKLGSGGTGHMVFGGSTGLGYPDNAGNHAHGASVDIAAFWTTYTGGGEAHNNIQPSIGVYVWLRIE